VATIQGIFGLKSAVTAFGECQFEPGAQHSAHRQERRHESPACSLDHGKVLNEEVCGSNCDTGNECENARKQQNVEDEADHWVRSPYSEPPLRRGAQPLLKLGGKKVTAASNLGSGPAGLVCIQLGLRRALSNAQLAPSQTIEPHVPPRFEERAASYPKWRILVRGPRVSLKCRTTDDEFSSIWRMSVRGDPL
jgi:hypothetical protein